ncbi:MAG TPA: NADH-quinone oxidoreductase subunit A [archaeon]|nr:NADH-quinone oxidoreductase subunit A [archaeon]
MIEDIIALLAFIGALLLFSISAILFSKMISPHKPDPIKNSTFECGETPIGEGRTQLTIQYYGYAIVFTLFDTLALFLFVSAASFTSIGTTALVPLLIFIGVVTLTLLYVLQMLINEYTYTPRKKDDNHVS